MNSPKRLARIAGVLYLLVAIFAAFPYSVFNGLYIAGDAATTAANVVAKAGVVRMAVVSDLVMVTAWVFLALTLYRLLKHVHPSAASAMVVLVAIGAGIVCLNTVFEFEGMRVATDSSYAAALGTGGANALVLMLLDTQRYGCFRQRRSSWVCGWSRLGISPTSQACSPRRWAWASSQHVSATTRNCSRPSWLPTCGQ